MRPRVVSVFVLLALLSPSLPAASAAQAIDCTAFSSWIWAQSIFELNPDVDRAAMDPDQDAIACEALPVGGIPPYLFAGEIPAGAEPVQLVGITDGDTFDIIDSAGNPDTVRLYHINAPETSNLGGGPQCGGDSATAQLSTILGLAGGTAYLEDDITQRDRFDRRLAYVWFTYGGAIFMANDAMVRTGFAESETFEPDVRYRDRLNAAEQFSVDKVLGVRLECGRFGQPPGSAPSPEQEAQARRNQPDQGQFEPAPAPAPPPAPAIPTPTPVPAPPAPAPQPGNCDPSYPGVCIPPVGVQGDLDCGDVSFRRFTVVPPDPHNFDGDFDGVGCESG